jgi:hypothetical protein
MGSASTQVGRADPRLGRGCGKRDVAPSTVDGAPIA